MGRKKLNKPGRSRRADHTLQQLQPPGYHEWIKVDAGPATADPHLTPDAADLLQRLGRLRAHYPGRVPLQAVHLDIAIDEGTVLLRDGDSVAPLPVARAAEALGVDPAGGEVRRGLHELHAHGGVLVGIEEGLTLLRVVSRRPGRPGEPWVFADTLEASVLPQVCIPARPGDISPEEFTALGFLRLNMAEGTVADPERFAAYEGIGSVERALELFAAVAELAEVKGCSACPSGHLCTRDPDA
ncbi:hypothetical protein OOK31_27080 [Streptomyces sp. NBC_00249]|uniref:hypothetical protein n=1 Tax=Streptomyces sp. NBC_00249 TaxID=2975690 RepID=UPI002255C9C7|nr:hypothetical protein [Streptomyces sp. NBC_00249]MCX5197516.1 hypothetical protein [Streptomyces sp. NBC_00249]